MTAIFATLFAFTIVIVAARFSVGDTHKWALYYATLGCVPAAYLLSLGSKEIRFFGKRLFDFPITYIGIAFTVGCLLIQPGAVNSYAFLLGFCVCTLFLFLLKLKYHEVYDSKERIFLVLISCASWRLAYRFAWWSPDHIRDDITYNSLILLMLLALVCTSLFESIFTKKIDENKKTNYFLEVIAIFSFIYFCGRPYVLSGIMLHHHSFYVGSIELIKQGGNLLWDVPSQYGLLNIYLASKINFGSTWQSFFIMNKVLIFISALLLYFLLRQFFQSVLGNILSLLLTISCIFCWAGSVSSLLGPFATPSVSAFRFIWCYAMISYCYFLSEKIDNFNQIKKIYYFVGHLIWLVSFFWSFESAIYSSSIWLTFNFVKSFNDINQLSFLSVLKDAFIKTLLLMRFPLLLFSFISIIYFFRTALWPDWEGYIEFAQIYKAGFGALPVDPVGAVWSLLSIFALGTIVAILSIHQKSPYSPFMFSGLALLWSVSSYFISRSHENNISNLAPLILLFLVVVLITSSRINLSRSLKISMFSFFVALFTLFLDVPITHPKIKDIFVNLNQVDYLGKTLQKEELPPETHYVENISEIYEAKNKLGIEINEPCVLSYEFLAVLPTDINQPQYWLPLAPDAQIAILSAERQQIYFDRFAKRKQMGGWILFIRTAQNINIQDRAAPIHKLLEKNYSLVETRAYGNWLAEKFYYRTHL